MQRLDKHGVRTEEKEAAKKSGALTGKTLVLTGTLSSMPRDEAKKLIKKHGGKVSSSVSKKTDFVVLGENPGSKAQKAEELSVKMISEDELREMVKWEG